MGIGKAGIRYLGGGDVKVTSFSDTMATAPANARNVISPPSDQWIYLILGGDSPYSSPISIATYGFGAALGGGFGLGLGIGAQQWGANPPYAMSTAIAPISTYIGSPVYTALKKFVQYTFNAVASGEEFGQGVGNFIDASGTGGAGSSTINHDFYTTNQSPTLSRWNSVSSRTILQSEVGPLNQGDILRTSYDFSVAGQVTITVTVNGTVLYTNIDNSANRVGSTCFPVIAVNGNGVGAGGSGSCKLWSCGVGL